MVVNFVITSTSKLAKPARLHSKRTKTYVLREENQLEIVLNQKLLKATVCF